MLKIYDLIEVLPDSPTNELDFSASYTDREGTAHNYTIFSTAYFIEHIYQLFTSRKIRLADTAPKAAFLTLFNIWKNSRTDSYARRAYALATKYEPLENYDRMEHKEGKVELEHGLKVEHSFDSSDKTEYSGSETDETGLYGVNSVTGVNSDTNTHSFTDREDEVTHSGTNTDENSGKDTTEDEYDLRAHGNIGVTTAAQMLEEDKKLLSYDLALLAVSDFVDRYTFFVEGVEL